MPRFVEYEISIDGKNFIPVGRVINNVSEKEDKPIIRSFEVRLENIASRYVQIYAKNIGECPV